MSKGEHIAKAFAKRVERFRCDIYERAFPDSIPDSQFWKELDQLEERSFEKVRDAGTMMRARALEGSFLRDFRDLCLQARRRGKLARGERQSRRGKAPREAAREDLEDPRRSDEPSPDAG